VPGTRAIADAPGDREHRRCPRWVRDAAAAAPAAPAAGARAAASPLKIRRVAERCCLEGGRSRNIYLGERREPGREGRAGSQRAGARWVLEGLGLFCSDPEGWARCLWPKPSLANTHHWHRPAELGMLLGSPRGFGFARNEMRRGWGVPLAEGVQPRFPSQGWGNKRRTRGDILSIAQLCTIGSGLAFSCCSLYACLSSSPAPALLFLPGRAAGAGSRSRRRTCPSGLFLTRGAEDV